MIRAGVETEPLGKVAGRSSSPRQTSLNTVFKPQGYSTVSPYLIAGGVSRTIEFLVRVCGAVELRRFPDAAGQLMHVALANGLPQSNCYVNVLRDALAVDSLGKCSVYFGTTGGQVYASADAGDSWAPIVRDLPARLSIEVQTLP